MNIHYWHNKTENRIFQVMIFFYSLIFMRTKIKWGISFSHCVLMYSCIQSGVSMLGSIRLFIFLHLNVQAEFLRDVLTRLQIHQAFASWTALIFLQCRGANQTLMFSMIFLMFVCITFLKPWFIFWKMAIVPHHVLLFMILF